MKNVGLKKWVFAICVLVIGALSFPLHAGSTTIAVAANFTKTIELIGTLYTQQTGHKVKFAFGSTGKLYAQIINGAPYDAFFSADELRPLKLVKQGFAEKYHYFVYAQGQMVLYSHLNQGLYKPLNQLNKAQFRHLAIANPKTAPYGEQALSVLKSLQLYPAVKSKLVLGESVGQAFQYVATENAGLGFLAYSQVVDPQSPLYKKGGYWLVPAHLYKPLNQGAVLLTKGQKNEVTKSFMTFMKSPQAIAIMQKYGYLSPQ